LSSRFPAFSTFVLLDMTNTTHEHFLRPNTKSRVQRRVDEMVAIFGGPEKVIGKPSATGHGIHIIFKEDADAEHTPRPRPHPLPPFEEEDIDMDELESNVDDEAMSQSSSFYGISSDLDHAVPHVQASKTQPTPTLDELRLCQRMENSQPKGWTDGNAPPGVSVNGDHAPTQKTSQVCSSDPPSDAVEAARQRVAQQRRDNAERIRIFQAKKLISLEAGLLRQRAADLEREAEEEEAELTGKTEIFISAKRLIRCRVDSYGVRQS
jgi:hypothetical protein